MSHACACVVPPPPAALGVRAPGNVVLLRDSDQRRKDLEPLWCMRPGFQILVTAFSGDLFQVQLEPATVRDSLAGDAAPIESWNSSNLELRGRTQELVKRKSLQIEIRSRPVRS